MKTRFVAALAFAFALVGIAPAASAQDPMDLHLSGFFALGAGGEQVFDGGVDAGLDATLGFGLRLEVPVIEYLTLGGHLSFNSWRTDGEADADRQWWFDVPDLIVRGRVPIRLGDSLLEPYVAFLIGGTISTLDEVGGDDVAYGWNVGMLAGAQYFFTEMFGVLLEVGWHRHAASHDLDLGPLNVEVDYWANQAALNFGGTVLF